MTDRLPDVRVDQTSVNGQQARIANGTGACQ